MEENEINVGDIVTWDRGYKDTVGDNIGEVIAIHKNVAEIKKERTSGNKYLLMVSNIKKYERK